MSQNRIGNYSIAIPVRMGYSILRPKIANGATDTIGVPKSGSPNRGPQIGVPQSGSLNRVLKIGVPKYKFDFGYFDD
jgi:hypothetical protein